MTAARVLIVVHEPADREVLAAVLYRTPGEDGGPYEFHFASDGAQGLRVAAALAGEAARGGPPLVVCCDLLMPEMSGLEFCVRLRHDPATRTLPVLAMTGIDDAAIWRDLRAAGADDIVLKPLEPREVRLRVGELAGRGR